MIYADRFVRGPFHLGGLSLVIASTAVLWIAFIAVVFCLPQLNPVNAQTLNYAPVAVAIVVLYSLGFWFVSARKWFTGPIRQIDGGKLKLRAYTQLGADRTDDDWLAEKEDIGVDPVIIDVDKHEFSEKHHPTLE